MRLGGVATYGKVGVLAADIHDIAPGHNVGERRGIGLCIAADKGNLRPVGEGREGAEVDHCNLTRNARPFPLSQWQDED